MKTQNALKLHLWILLLVVVGLCIVLVSALLRSEVLDVGGGELAQKIVMKDVAVTLEDVSAPPVHESSLHEVTGAGLLDVYVTDREAVPIADIPVNVFAHSESSWNAPTPFKGISDSSGRCRIPGLPWGRYTVRAVDGQFAGVAQASISQLRQIVAVELVLKPAEEIVGRVRDTMGNPIGGARVVLLNRLRGSNELGATLSDTAGAFGFVEIPLGRYRLQVTAQGFAPELSRDVGIGEPPLTIQLSAGGGLALVAFGELTGNPISNMAVTLELPDFSNLEFTATSDKVGNVSFSNLPGGRCVLRSSDSRYVLDPLETEIEASIGRINTGKLMVKESASVFGRVTDGDTGEPVSGVSVVVSNAPARTLRWNSEPTGPDGVYELSGLAPGDCEVAIEVLPRPYSALYEENILEVKLDAREEKRGLDFVLYRGHGVEGIVLDETGLPVTGASVRLHGYRQGEDHPSVGPRTLTDAAGHFYFDGLNLFSMRVDADGVLTESENDVLQAVTLQAEFRGATSEETGRLDFPASGLEGIVLQLRHQEGGAISGHVVDARGVPVVARVRCDRADALGTVGNSGVFSDVDGFFLLQGVPAGSYILSADPYDDAGLGHASSRALDVHVTLDRHVRNLRLTLQEGLEIRGRLVDDKGSPVKHCMITATHIADLSNQSEAVTDDSGNFILRSLDSGDYRLEFGIGYGVQGNSGRPPQVVTAGSEVEIVWGVQ